MKGKPSSQGPKRTLRTAEKQRGRPFQPGQSGNPGGRPKIIAEVRDLAREHTATAIEALVRIVESTKAPPAARVSAATAILDRGWGKPTQPIAGDPEMPPVSVEEHRRDALATINEAIAAVAAEDFPKVR